MGEEYCIISDHKTVQTKRNVKMVKAAVLAHLFYEEQVDYCRKYLERVPDSIDVVIFSSKQGILNRFRNDRYIKIGKENRGRDISALLVAARKLMFKYKYICFIHDKKEKSPDDREYIELWRKNMWDNMLQSSAFVYNVIDLFEENSKLGMLVPLPPHMGDKGVWLRGGWGNTFQQIRNLADEIGIESNICYEYPPFTYSTVFWARASVLERLFLKDWKYTDFPEEPMRDYGEVNHAVERILQYVVEDAGYETKIVLSSTFASGFIQQLKEEMSRLWSQLETVFGITQYSEIDQYSLRIKKVKQLKKKYTNIYLYGAGKAARDCLKMCFMLDIKPEGILVTDMGNTHEFVEGIQVLPIAKFTPAEGSGIMITVYKKEYQDEMKKELKKRGFHEYMVF